MKTGKRLEREAHFLCKVQSDDWLDRLVWWAFRRYLLNEDHFRVSQRFTGPRPYGTNQDSTIKSNATHRRMYIEVRHKPVYRPISSLIPRKLVQASDLAEGAS